MKRIIILQAGVAKSGNYWLYRILQSVIRHGNLEQRSFIQNHPIHERAKTWDLSFAGQADIDVLDIEPSSCFYRISSVFRMPIEDINDYLDQCTHVWTHSAFCERSLGVLPKFDKVVYIIREPRDVAISMSRFAFTPYMKKHYPHGEPDPDTWLAHRLEDTMKHWVQHVGGYLKHKDDLQIHVVFYERLLRSFDTELAHLLDYLDIELEEKAIGRIRYEIDFKAMKSENPRHVRKGKSGEWTQVLTDVQKRQAARIAGPMLGLLNYPVGEDQIDTLPCVPAQVSSSQLEKATAHAGRRTLMEKVKRVYQFLPDRTEWPAIAIRRRL